MSIYNDDQTRLVLERAQRAVEDRKAAAHAARMAPRLPMSDSRERAWVAAWCALLITLVGGALVILPGSLIDRLALLVYGMCDQKHTLAMGMTILPLCQRDTAMYTSAVATLLTLLIMGRGRAAHAPPRAINRLLLAGMIWMTLDGLNSFFFDYGPAHLYTPQPRLRILSGLAMGTAAATFLMLLINAVMRGDPNREQRIVQSWREIGLLVIVQAIIVLLLFQGPGWAAIPLALVSTGGMGLMLLGMNLLIVGVVGRMQRASQRLRQLARPATLALIMTGLQCGLLAWVRSNG